MLVHNVIAPNFGDLNARLDEMEAAASTGKVAAFKVYTAWGPNGQGFALDDPAIGLPVIQKAHDLGVKIFIAHKGLPLVRFDAAHNQPDDMVAVSRHVPRHAVRRLPRRVGQEPSSKARTTRRDPSASTRSCARSTDIRCRRTATSGSTSARCGARCCATRPPPRTPSGKLLKRVGEHRVLWGTDAVWYGSPQAQIQAFRAFTISNEFQDAVRLSRAHAERVKAQVLGLNAAQALQDRSRRPALRFHARPVDPRQAHRGRASRRRRAPVRRTALQRPDDAPRDARVARASGDTRWTPL